MSHFNKVFNGKNDAVKFVDGYGSMILEGKIKTAEEQEPKLLKAKNKHQKFSIRIAWRIYKLN